LLEIHLHSSLAIVHVGKTVILLRSEPITVILAIKMRHICRLVLSVDLSLVLPVNLLIGLVWIGTLGSFHVVNILLRHAMTMTLHSVLSSTTVRILFVVFSEI
jgi:hypothetical protein